MGNVRMDDAAIAATVKDDMQNIDNTQITHLKVVECG